MADEIFDAGLETLLRGVLRAEVANLPLTVRPEQILERAAQRRAPGRIRLPQWIAVRPTPGLLRMVVALLAVALIAAAAVVGSNLLRRNDVPPAPLPPASPSVTATPQSDARLWCKRPASTAGSLLGCSRDGTRLLVQKDDEMFVVRADGSETQVTEQLSGFKFRLPRGGTISPDGSRVVFAGLTKTPEEAGFCHDGALFAVKADGGPAELLWTSHIPQNGWISFPTFSPDGTQIAFADGYCDWGHTVWVMNADGSGAHQIVSDSLGGGWVDGLAWSPAGDRIALIFQGFDVKGLFTFAPDGSGFTAGGNGSTYCWPSRLC